MTFHPWSRRSIAGLLSTFALAIGATGAAHAQIIVGQTAGITGQVAASVKELNLGARLYLDHINATGGVGGQKIELVSMDDAFDPKRSATNAQALIDKGAVALFLTRGTPHTQAVMPLLEKYQLPLIAPSTGASLLHKPVHPYVFNVRSTYQREAERAVQLLLEMGNTRIAIVQVNDTFGQDAAQGALRGLTDQKTKPVLHLTYDREKPDVPNLVKQVMTADPQVVLFISTQQVASETINALRAAGSRTLASTLSNNASAGFIQLLGQNAAGVIVSQVFPNERNMTLPMVREVTDLAKAKQAETGGIVTPAMMEGFVSAKVLVEAIRRAGKDVSRAGITRALNGMTKYDLGGIDIGFSPTDHTGASYADIAIIDPRGRFLR
ncbi:ABC transporter substrate-binding protein [Roseateles amylovorans]|jgi:branched-chain amino acid transport system substrate-binding protein|uniref:ABC transporter substrate-binding protein n=1 Tax=Roseateles amylovorans TaxID=2978473 RepID=A0ABY6B5T3_9BURK|nr:ABC transporter substrate-binding protein [Roseateles amylovorans]UXH80207.1 ABC transporter substrate-binding protein [Roseateles amylovorans]